MAKANTDTQTTEPETKTTEPDTTQPAAEFEPMTIHYPDLETSHGKNADFVYQTIAQQGGFGSMSKDFVGKDNKPTYPDLDFSGASDEMKAKIAKILQTGK